MPARSRSAETTDETRLWPRFVERFRRRLTTGHRPATESEQRREPTAEPALTTLERRLVAHLSEQDRPLPAAAVAFELDLPVFEVDAMIERLLARRLVRLNDGEVELVGRHQPA